MSESFFQKIRVAVAAGPIHSENAPKPDLAPGRIYTSGLSTEERIDLFTKRAAAAGAAVHRPRSFDELMDTIRRVVPAGAAVGIDPALPRAGYLAAALKADYTVYSLPAPDEDTVFSTTAVLTAVDVAVAETGSIVLASRETCLRLASTTAEIHLALIRPDQLVPDSLDVADQIKKLNPAQSPAAFTIISGPSKTADIEMNLVIGVHGPAQMHMILLPD